MDRLKSKVFNNLDAKGRKQEYDFREFKELETCTLNRFEINDEIIQHLNEMKKLKLLIFNHCNFQNEKKLESNIENLIITYGKNMKFENIKNAYNIKELMCTRLGKIDVNEIKIFENLERLSIFECDISNFLEIQRFEKLQELKLDGSKIDNKESIELLKKRIKITYNETYHVGF